MPKFGSVWFHRDIAFALRAIGTTMSHSVTVLHHGGHTYTIDTDGVITHDGERVPRGAVAYCARPGTEIRRPRGAIRGRPLI